MNAFSFYFGSICVLCGTKIIIFLLTKCDKIRNISIKLNMRDGLKITGRFYK